MYELLLCTCNSYLSILLLQYSALIELLPLVWSFFTFIQLSDLQAEVEQTRLSSQDEMSQLRALLEDGRHQYGAGTQQSSEAHALEMEQLEAKHADHLTLIASQKDADKSVAVVNAGRHVTSFTDFLSLFSIQWLFASSFIMLVHSTMLVMCEDVCCGNACYFSSLPVDGDDILLWY